ncbi:MAG: GNAT superfamily N-acetyltransferase [Gammaproteobacteria bacterium]|jgi:GNAT superfamily N-acetyltransferase
MKIRPMRVDDIPAVHEMILALGAYHGDLDAAVTPETILRDGIGPHPWIRFLVAEDADGLQGYAALLPLAKIADGIRGVDINHMYVAEGLRRQGIGRKLIDAATDVARTLGCAYLFIGTAPDNIAAQEAYLACGFARWTDGGPRFRLPIA